MNFKRLYLLVIAALFLLGTDGAAQSMLNGSAQIPDILEHASQTPVEVALESRLDIASASPSEMTLSSTNTSSASVSVNRASIGGTYKNRLSSDLNSSLQLGDIILASILIFGAVYATYEAVQYRRKMED